MEAAIEPYILDIVEHLQDLEITFQQNVARPHYSIQVMNWISATKTVALSPDLTRSDFFLLYSKAKLYTAQLDYIVIFKQRIYEEYRLNSFSNKYLNG